MAFIRVQQTIYARFCEKHNPAETWREVRELCVCVRQWKCHVSFGQKEQKTSLNLCFPSPLPLDFFLSPRWSHPWDCNEAFHSQELKLLRARTLKAMPPLSSLFPMSVFLFLLPPHSPVSPSLLVLASSLLQSPSITSWPPLAPTIWPSRCPVSRVACCAVYHHEERSAAGTRPVHTIRHAVHADLTRPSHVYQLV